MRQPINSYLRAAGQERLDVDIGVMNFEVVVTESACHADGGQHPCLENKPCTLGSHFLKKEKSI